MLGKRLEGLERVRGRRMLSIRQTRESRRSLGDIVQSWLLGTPIGVRIEWLAMLMGRVWGIGSTNAV